MLKVCKQCGMTFSTDRANKYCEDCRSNRQEYKAARRNNDKTIYMDVIASSVCLICGEKFTAKKWGDTLCSKCKLIMQRIKENAG